MTLELPVAPAAQEKALTRVLIIEDEPTIRESLAGVLLEEGYDVTASGRTEEALSLLREDAFDIVLIDLDLMEPRGPAAIRAATDRNPLARAIVMTCEPSVDECLQLLRDGAWDYMPKPFSAAHLRMAVAKAANALAYGSEPVDLGAAGEESSDMRYRAARDRAVTRFELGYLRQLLTRATGNMSEAARIGEVDRTTLYRMMMRHGLHRSAHGVPS